MHARTAFSGARWRAALVILAMATLAWASAPASRTAAAAPLPPAGLSVAPAPAGLTVTSEGRFELQIDQGGIAAWYDLRSDPGRSTSLVAPGAHLVEQRARIGGEALAAAPALARQGPLRARVVWRGALANGQAFETSYDIWAGGQVVITTRSAEEVDAALALAPGAASGAALQTLASGYEPDGTRWRTAVLFLGSWGGDGGGAAQQQLALGASFDPRTAAVEAQASGPADVRVPDGLVRQPRLVVAGWPGPDVTVRRAGATLVAGQDYLSEWDPATGELSLQYLGLLAPGDAAARTFSLTPAPAAGPALSLGISGKTLDETTGRLVVDANLTTAQSPYPMTTADVFQIPYIQTTAQATVTAVTQGAPAGSGVQIVLDGTVVGTSFGTSLQFPISLGAMGEHHLQGFIVNASGQRISQTPDDTIDPLGYGRIISAIGDSLTAGVNGYYVGPGGAGDSNGPIPYIYPVTSPETSPEKSGDSRNFYQRDAYEASLSDYYYRGFELALNNQLTGCSQAPVFILNDGVSGNTIKYFANSGRGSINQNSVYARHSQYKSHIQALGAGTLLLGIGTNDVSSYQLNYDYQTYLDDMTAGLNESIDALQADNPGVTIWIARMPWRDIRPPANQPGGETTAQYDARLQATQDLNARIAAVVAAQNTPSTPVKLGPDFYTFFATNQSYFAVANGGNYLHPNQAGLDQMAQLWSDLLCPTFPPPDATPTPTSTTVPGATPFVALPVVVR